MIKLEDIKKCPSYIDSISQEEEFSDDILITTDSRHIDDKNTFIAIKGENFDGNNFIDLAIKNGIKVIIAFLSDGQYEDFHKKYPKILFVRIHDANKFLLELAEIASLKWQIGGGIVIGITGSNGKTTNKEMLFSLLNSIEPGKVHKTAGNFNNHIGVPLTLFSLTEEKSVVIIEMGMNHAGEIAPLAKAARPTCGLITSIGPAHLENLGSIENVFLEKKSLFDFIDNKNLPSKLFVINNNDEFLTTLPDRAWCYRLTNDNFVVSDEGFKLYFGKNWYEVTNKNLFGDYNKVNLAQCLLLTLCLYPDRILELVDAASTFRMPSMNRGEVRKIGDVAIYLDAYNANPSSVRASLSAFEAFCRQDNIEMKDRWYILGDMNELGSQAENYHRAIGQAMNKLNIAHVSFVGRYGRCYQDGFQKDSSLFLDHHDLKNAFKKEYTHYKSIFIKASRSLQLESILDINDDLKPKIK